MSEGHGPDGYGSRTGAIAHDFNNLLTAINGYADLCLSQVPEDGYLHEWLDEIRQAGAKASELARTLLELSHEQRDAFRHAGAEDGEGPSPGP
jgi:signal transduction histidine kinase